MQERKEKRSYFRRGPQYKQPRGVHRCPVDPAIPSLPAGIMTVGFSGDREMAHRLLLLVLLTGRAGPKVLATLVGQLRRSPRPCKVCRFERLRRSLPTCL